MGLTTPSWKNLIVQKPCKGCRTDLGRGPRKRNKDKDMMLATWNVRSLCRPGALAKVKDELNKWMRPGLYKLRKFQVANVISLSLFRLHGCLPRSVRHPLYGFWTTKFSRMGLSTPCPTPSYPGGPMFSVRVVSLSWPVSILKRRELAFHPYIT